MKIEIGESLIYSWLRHIKRCQIVQTNWKTSPQWELEHEDDLQILMNEADEYFYSKYNLKIFKQNTLLSQFLKQGECDAIGISVKNGENSFFAVDVAFHSSGLSYGTKNATIMKVIEKTVRTAMCLWGYLGTKKADITFASPKVTPAVLNGLEPCIDDLNHLFMRLGYEFHASIVTNNEFNDSVLQPTLHISEGVADTSELFLRSYQMYKMFLNPNTK